MTGEEVISSANNIVINGHPVEGDNLIIRDNADWKKEQPSSARKSTHVIPMGEREIEATVVKSDNHAQITVNGNNEPLDLDLEALRKGTGLSRGIQLLVSVSDAPGSTVENYDLTGENITLVDSPNSIIRNNTVQDIVQTTGTAVSGIRLQNCSNSIIYNNTLRNITHSISGTAYAYGIVVVDSFNVTIQSNIIEKINATSSAGTAYPYGIYVQHTTDNVNRTIIEDNTISDIFAKAATYSNVMGIYIEAESMNKVTVTTNVIDQNNTMATSTNTYGIQLNTDTGGGNPTITNTTISNNSIINNVVTTTTGSAETYGVHLLADILKNLLIIDNNIGNNSASGTSNANSHGICLVKLENIPVDFNNITIRNNFIDQNQATVTSAGIAETHFIYFEADADGAIANLTVQNNTVTNNAATTASGTAESYGIQFICPNLQEILITENLIENNSVSATGNSISNGLFFKNPDIGPGSFNDVTITNNIIDQNNASTATSGSSRTNFIHLVDTGSSGFSIFNLTIYNNTVNNNWATTASGAGNSYGISLSASDGINTTQIIANEINNNIASATTGGNSYAISFAHSGGGAASFSNITLSNNAINGNNVSSTSGFATTYAIYFSGSGVGVTMANITIFNNTITDNVATSNSGTGTSFGIMLGTGGEIKNVIISENSFDSPVVATNIVASSVIRLQSEKDITNIIVSKNVVDRSDVTTSSGDASTSFLYIYNSMGFGAYVIRNVTISDNIVTSNFAITGSGDSVVYGIDLGGVDIDRVNIYNNLFMNNSAIGTSDADSYGIQLLTLGSNYNINNTAITSNTFTDNSATTQTVSFSGQAYGIRLLSDVAMTNITISGNIISDTSVSASTSGNAYSYGISLTANSGSSGRTITNVTLAGNTISNSMVTTKSGNAYAYGIAIIIDDDTNDLFITNNDINLACAVGTGYVWALGISIEASSSNTIANVLVADNTVDNSSAISTGNVATSYGVQIRTDGSLSAILVANNIFNDNSAKGESTGTTVYGLSFISGFSTVVNVTAINNSFVDNTVTSVTALVNSYGIFVSSDGNLKDVFLIDNVFDLNFALTSAVANANARGIYINTGPSGTKSNILIRQNSFTNSSAFGDPATCYGIDITGGGASDIVIEGNSFTETVAIASNVAAYANAYGINFNLDSSLNFTISGNRFGNNSAINPANNAASFGIFLSMSSTDILDITIEDNIFSDSRVIADDSPRSYGVYFSSSGDTNNTLVRNNTFAGNVAIATNSNAEAWGIYFMQGDIFNSTISNNSLFSSASTPYAAKAYGVYLDTPSTISNVTISDNTIACFATSPEGSALVWGVYLSSSNKFISLLDNTLVTAFASGNSSAQIRGMYLYTGTNNTIAGNLFENITATAVDGDANVYGLYQSDGYNTTIANNTIEVISSSAPNNSSYAYGLYLIDDANFSIHYNVILSISATNQTHDYYLSNTYGVEIRIEAGLGVNITWTDPGVTNPLYLSFTVYRNTGTESQGTWNETDGVILGSKNLTEGVYNYTIYIYNATHNVTETIFITVHDTRAPNLSTTQGATYEEGDTGNDISWTFTDLFPNNYTILYNDTGIHNGTSWTSGVAITWDVDGLGLGTHNYTIVITDDTGNSASHTILVVVVDTTEPVITAPNELIYELGATDQTLVWNATDYNPATYTVYHNGSQYDTDSWISGGTITVNVTGLPVGTHNFTIVFGDTSSNSESNTVIVTVVDTTAPIITSPSDITYDEGATGNNVTWQVTDLSNGTFIAYLDDVPISNATAWTSGDLILLNVDGLTPGTYNLTIVATDTYGNSVSDTVLITVTSATSSEPGTEDETSSDEASSDGGINPILIGGILIGSLGAALGGLITFRRIRMRGS